MKKRMKQVQFNRPQKWQRKFWNDKTATHK